MLDYFVYALVGKLLIFLWQQFPLSGYLSSKSKLLQKLFGCDLCLGVWIYWFLAIVFEEANMFLYIVDKYIGNPGLAVFFYIFTAFLTGAITSFIVHIFSMGWNAKFQTLVVE
jgi:hypothetical protein